MNLKLKALLYTAGFVVGCSIISYCLIWTLSVLSQQTIIWIASACGIGFLLYMMYNLILNKLKYDEKIVEIQKNISK